MIVKRYRYMSKKDLKSWVKIFKHFDSILEELDSTKKFYVPPGLKLNYYWRTELFDIIEANSHILTETKYYLSLSLDQLRK